MVRPGLPGMPLGYPLMGSLGGLSMTPPLVGTRFSPITWFIWRLIEGAFLYFLAMPIVALMQIIGTPLSLGTGLPLPWIPPLLAGLVISMVVLYRAHKR